MTGRTVNKNSRVYLDGYDMSGYTTSIGPLSVSANVVEQAALTDEVTNGLPGHISIKPGVVNAFFDDTETSGFHIIMKDGTGNRTLMVAMGDKSAPADGAPCFAGQFEQLDYLSTGENFLNATVTLGDWSGRAASRLYNIPWGTLLHAHGAVTGANTINSGIGSFKETSSALGGFMVYQVFSGNGTATISIDDSAANSSWLALSDATTGELDMSSVQHGVVALGTTATVRRYLRWQISLATATTVTFALAFIRPE